MINQARQLLSVWMGKQFRSRSTRVRLVFFSLFVVMLFGGKSLAGGDDDAGDALDGLKVEVVRDPAERWHVESQVVIEADPETAWNVLTDYDHMADYVPSILVSKSTEVAGFPAVEQVGHVRFLIFRITARALFLQNENQATRTISFVAVEGDFHQYEGWWKILEDADHSERVVLSYRASVHPKIFLPKWIIQSRIKKEVRRSLKAIAKEILRREKKTSN